MARVQRLYVEAALWAGAEIALSPEQAHRLARVLRLRPGAPIALFNAADGEWRAQILQIDRSAAVARVEAQIRAPVPEPGLTLLFAPLRGGRTELVVEKATELGVAAIQPVLCAHAVADKVKPEKLRAIGIEAAEQCERLSVPDIRPLAPLFCALAGWPADRPLAVCAERADVAPLAALAGRAAGVLIGPEGGFAPMELDRLRALDFVHPASLGPRILRAETAALAALAILGARA